MSDKVVLGFIAGPHGVQGAVKIRSACEPPEAIFNYKPWCISAPDGRVLTESALKLRAAGGNLAARIPSIEDRDLAQSWHGAEISCAREALPKLNASEFYWADLIGLRVHNEQGVDLGVIDHLLATGSNDVMVVQGERERLLPYLPGDFVKSVDLKLRTMIVDWDPDF
jgi:16S rRNA processing protein RimM